MTFKETLTDKFDKIKPFLSKTASSTAQGYVFGCMVGLFTKEEKTTFTDMVKHINRSGCKFATVGAIYSTTESAMETIRGTKCPLNSLVAGTISASYVNRENGNPGLCGIGFGFYSGISEFNRNF